jgi:hypothetical protein
VEWKGESCGMEYKNGGMELKGENGILKIII